MLKYRGFNKYKNIRTCIDGIMFSSKKEGEYYCKLKILKLAKEIKDFRIQVKYPIIINKALVCNYISDFNVVLNDGSEEVVDVKGVKTPIYLLKKKLMKAVYNIDIIEK